MSLPKPATRFCCKPSHFLGFLLSTLKKPLGHRGKRKEIFMKIAISTYSYQRLLNSGAMNQMECIAKTKEMGADAIEFVDILPHDGSSRKEYAQKLRDACERAGLEISCYTVAADFIGGSGGNLCKMLDTIYTKNSDCRVVINAITIETLIEVVEYYKTRSEYELEIVNVFAARGKKLGEYNLMMGQNPVYIMTALKKGE